MKTDHSLIAHTSRDLIVVSWTENLDRAYALMLASRVHHLPVVDDDGRIIGIMSDHDFQRAMQIDQPDFYSGKTPHAEFDLSACVRDYMSWPVETIPEEASIVAAARMMIERKISSLLVTRDRFAVGIITTQDLLRVLIGDEIDAEPVKSTKEGALARVYASSVGKIVQALSDVGI